MHTPYSLTSLTPSQQSISTIWINYCVLLSLYFNIASLTITFFFAYRMFFFFPKWNLYSWNKMNLMACSFVCFFTYKSTNSWNKMNHMARSCFFGGFFTYKGTPLENGLYFVLNSWSSPPTKWPWHPSLKMINPLKVLISYRRHVQGLKWYSLTLMDTVLRQEHMPYLSM